MRFSWNSYRAWKPEPPTADSWAELRDPERAKRIGLAILQQYFVVGFRNNLTKLLWVATGLAVAYASTPKSLVFYVGALMMLAGVAGWIMSTLSLGRATMWGYLKWRRLQREAQTASTHEAFLRGAYTANCLNTLSVLSVVRNRKVSANDFETPLSESAFVEAVLARGDLQRPILFASKSVKSTIVADMERARARARRAPVGD